MRKRVGSSPTTRTKKDDMPERVVFFILRIEPPYPQIEVCGKCHPKEIGNLQLRSRLIHLPEREDHQKNQSPQRNQPDEGEAKVLEIEKQDAPEKIKGQLKEEKPQTSRAGAGCRRQINSRRSDPHQGKENAPYDREYDARWRERRLLNGCIVDFAPFPCQPPGKSPDGFCENNPERIGFPC